MRLTRSLFRPSVDPIVVLVTYPDSKPSVGVNCLENNMAWRESPVFESFEIASGNSNNMGWQGDKIVFYTVRTVMDLIDCFNFYYYYYYRHHIIIIVIILLLSSLSYYCHHYRYNLIIIIIIVIIIIITIVIVLLLSSLSYYHHYRYHLTFIVIIIIVIIIIIIIIIITPLKNCWRT